MKLHYTIGITLLLVLAACAGPGQHDEVAKCISASGAKFYGAFWCPHCNTQKELFGPSMQHITYIECSTPDKKGQTEVCVQANIQSYPTWEFADGSRESGVLEIEYLAEKTGCNA